jgi:tetratricopeptide (TPR) repeat protein
MSDHYELIQEAWNKNQFPKALEHARILATNEPDNPFAHRVIIDALNKLDRPKEADEYAATVLSKHADPLLHLSFAGGAIQAQNWEEADRRFAQLVSRFPDFPAGYNTWFSAYVARGDVPSGEQLLGSVVDKFAGDVWVFHNWAQAAVLRGDLRTGAARFRLAARRFPDHVAAYFEAARCHFLLREFAAAHAFSTFVLVPSALEGAQRSTLQAFIGALDGSPDSLGSAGPENELGRLLAAGQSHLSAGNAELALETWARCRERDTTGTASIGIVESLLRLERTTQSATELASLIEEDHIRLSYFAVHIALQLCAELYMLVLHRQGEIPRDAFHCLRGVIAFVDGLIEQRAGFDNTGIFEWLRAPMQDLFRGSTYRPYIQDFGDLRSLYAGIRSDSFRKLFSSFYKLLDSPASPSFSTLKIPPSPRIAVLLCGQDRGYEQSLAKLREFLDGRSVSLLFVTWNRAGLRLPTPEPGTIHHLVRVFPHATVDIIANCGPSAAELFSKLSAFRDLFEQPLIGDEVRRKIGADHVEIEDELKFEHTCHEKITRLANRFGAVGQHTTATNSAKMVYMNWRAWRVLEQFEQLSGNKFDLVLRMRPDLLLSSRYKLNDLEEMIGGNARFMLVDQLQDNVVVQSGDKLSFAGRDAMKIYCDLWERWDGDFQGCGDVCHITAPHNRIVDFMLEQDVPLKLLEGVTAGYDGSRRFTNSQLRAALTTDLDSGRLNASEADTVRKIITSLELSQ